MNYEFISDIDESGQTEIPMDVLTVSENDVDIEPETAPEDELESETPVETPVSTVSGNEVPFDSSSDVSGNGVFVPYDDSDIVTGINSLQTEMQLLQNDMSSVSEQIKETNAALAVISSLVAALLFFTLFKWCEQKIKRFGKGLVNRNE